MSRAWWMVALLACCGVAAVEAARAEESAEKRGVQATEVGWRRGGGGCTSCGPTGGTCEVAAPAAPQYQTVEKTIMVPTWVQETRLLDSVTYQTEQRQRTVTVNRRVPETKSVTQNYTVLVPEQRTRTETYTVNKPVTKQMTKEVTVQVPHVEERQGMRKVCKYVPTEVTKTVLVPEQRTRTENYTVCKPVHGEKTVQYTVMVPHQVTKEGTRNVCRWVPTTETRTVRKDEGHYEEVTQEVLVSASGCGDCGSCCRRGLFRRRCCYSGCGSSCGTACGSACETSAPAMTTVTKKVWVPNIVEKQIEVTVNKKQVTAEPYSWTETVCQPETRTKTVHVTSYERVTMTREVPYTVCVPTEKTMTVNKPTWEEVPYTYNVTVCKPETKTMTYNVVECIAEQHTREVAYTVCVPEQRTRTFDVTTYTCVPEQVTQTYNVCVPVKTQKEVTVNVCKMVPKTVTVQVPVCGVCK